MRRKYPKDHVERLDLPSQPELEEGEPHSGGEESVSEAPEEEGPGAKRLLPDRTVAAHNRANEKLVAFIVSQRLADRHLLVRRRCPGPGPGLMRLPWTRSWSHEAGPGPGPGLMRLLRTWSGLRRLLRTWSGLMRLLRTRSWPHETAQDQVLVS